MLLRLLCAVLMIGVLVGPAHAINLFTEDFESSLATLQAKYACSYSSPTPFTDGAAQDWDTAQKFAGSYALKQTYTGSQYDTPYQGGGSCEKDFDTLDPGGTNRKDVWITWYHFFSPTWQGSGGGGVGGVATKGLYMYMKSLSTGQVNGWVFHYFNGGNQLTMSAQGIKDHRGPNGPGTGTVIPYDTENMWQNVAPYEQPEGRWVCYEANYKLNDPGQSNGQYVLYSTDMTAGGSTVLRASHTGREFVGTTPTDRMPSDARWFRIKYYRQDGLGSMWYDNTYVDSTRRGCSGAPPPSDTTAPGQVTGLSVVSNTDTSITYTWTASSATDLQSYIIRGCTPGACTNFATIGTVPAGTTTFTWNGRSPSTLYRVQVAAQDSSGNVGTASSIVDDTTDASSVLPGVTGFTASATGGTITYTGTPTDFRIEFGGDFAGSTSIIRTLAQVPGGALSFVWPASTNWACIRARDAVATEGPVYRCNQVQASTGGVLRQHPTNGRWFTDDSGRAILLAGMSGTLTEPNATRSALQDFTVTAPTDNFARADSADLGASWSAGYSAGTTFKIDNNGVECSVVLSNACLEMHSTARANDQAAEVLIRSWAHSTTEAVAGVVLRMAAAPTNTYYYFLAHEAAGVYNTTIEKYVAGVNTILASSATYGWGPGDIIRGTASGTTLTLYRNGVPILTTTDASIASGSAGMFIYNAGSVTGDIVLDEFYAWDLADADPTVNDYNTAFDSLVTDGLNFARLWVHSDQTSWGEAAWYATGGEPRVPTLQLPWLRTGVSTNCTPGYCVMIGRYDLDSWNEAFFTRVRQRVLAARAKGIKVAINLFDAWGANQTTYQAFSSPFASGNNEQGITCDANANGKCEEVHTLSNVLITPYQRAYVKKMVDTLGDLDNIFWEIVNEPNQAGSQAWQEDMEDTIRAYELTKGYDHLIMQGPYVSPLTSSNTYLRASSFDVIAPSCLTAENYDTNPPVADGLKIEMIDTDHTGESDMCGVEVSGWPWKTFLRGRHPILLGERESAGTITQLKEEMAQTINYANRINLAAMTPASDTTIFSTAYGLAYACSEYLMYMPSDGASTIDLTACGGTYDVEYMDVTDSTVSSGGTTTGGAVRSFNPTGSNPMIVYLKLNSVTDTTAPIISGGQPNGAQASGTTSVTVTVVTDKAATCKLDPTAGTAYGSMATTFSTTGALLHTQSVGSLSDGTSYARYVKCSGTASGVASADYPVAWSVLTAAAVVPPANVTGLRGTLNESTGVILWQWDAVSGADRYLLEISEGGTFLVAVETSSNAGTSYQQGSLTVGSYSARIKAVTTSNVQSVDWATGAGVSATLPAQLTGLTETSAGVYSTTVILTWTAPTNSNLVAILERCTGAACTDFSLLGGVSAVGYTDSNLTASTVYCYRAKYSNPVFGGTSASWSSTYCATTRSVAATGNGLIQPRIPLPYGVTRLPRN